MVNKVKDNGEDPRAMEDNLRATEDRHKDSKVMTRVVVHHKGMDRAVRTRVEKVAREARIKEREVANNLTREGSRR